MKLLSKFRNLFALGLICTFAYLPICTFANNIVVSGTTLTGQVAASDYTFVQFNLSWDNSWRTSTGAANWDAAWVFVKYKVDGGSGCTAGGWKHASLSSTSGDHSVTTVVSGGTPTLTAITNPTATNAVGVMIYRSADGTGSTDWQGVKLRWNYGTGGDGLADGCDVSVKVMAIEMVYVPTGSFYVGDGRTVNPVGALTASGSTSAYQITNENSKLLGGTGGDIYNNNTTGQYLADDFNNATQKTLPAAYPKGYAAFYCMKYECSQEQYMEFLMTANSYQVQQARTNATTANYYHGTGSTTQSYRMGIRCKQAPSATVFGEYGDDLDGDLTLNETTSDGRYIAANYISGMDALAYLDWSGLRPMTDLEYEKAARGTNVPSIFEGAWGTANIIVGTTNGYLTGMSCCWGPGGALQNSGATNELPNALYTPSATAGGAMTASTITWGNGFDQRGPLRCGILATATSTRIQAGASYYGILELTGNVNEMVVGIGNAAGRSYTGLHGDGLLSTAGTCIGCANVDYWPGVAGNTTYTATNGTVGADSNRGYAGLEIRGGSFGITSSSPLGTTGNVNDFPVSSRFYANRGSVDYGYISGRDYRTGFRGVRTP